MGVCGLGNHGRRYGDRVRQAGRAGRSASIRLTMRPNCRRVTRSVPTSGSLRLVEQVACGRKRGEAERKVVWAPESPGKDGLGNRNC